MKLTTRLTQFVLRQALGELGNQSLYWLQQHFTDPTRALPAAIDEANTRTWHVLELALTGDSFTGWLRQKLAKGAERGILVPLREWLKGQGEPFLRACLTELRAAGAAGMLTTDNTGQELLTDWGVAGVANQAAVAADASLLLNEISRDLQDYYPNLALFLAGPDVNLLPAIFGYFLRQAVLERPELKEALNFERLAQVWQGQTQGFTDLNNLLTEHRAAVMERLAQFGLGFNELTQQQVEIKEMLQQIHARLPNSARAGGVSPRLSSMLRSASDVRLLTELEQRLNNLPPASRTPQVLDAVGRLAMAVGIFPTAQQHFAQAATLAHASGASNIEAEAYYNTYRALLEQRQFATALTALQAAVSLAPAKFAPFPMDKYVPQRILGAGGFGVAFLCQHLHLDELIVIKTLYQEELERNIAEFFREGRILRKLRHPSIIEITDCDYAGAQPQRPFVVMEYFAGQSLTEYLQQQGALPLEQALALARLLAEALLAAHQLNILHRDIKPDNVLVQRQENSWHIKVIDFGLAIAGKRILQTVAAGNASQSLLGLSVGGTFQYSAPEQLGTLPGGKIGTWSDVYAFGKTLSYALFKTTQPSQKNYRALGEHWFGDLLSECMEQHPAERPQDFMEVLRRLGIGKLPLPAQPAQFQTQTQTQSQLIVQDVQHGHYIIHPNGTVTDTRTKLMWKRCCEGQTWDGTTCIGEAKGMTWNEIMPNGKQKSWTAFAGHNDWRVPTLDELISLVYCSSGSPKTWNDTGGSCEGEYQSPTIDKMAFPNTPDLWFLTATPDAADSSYSCAVDFSYGDVGDIDRYSSGFVRCVWSK